MTNAQAALIAASNLNGSSYLPDLKATARDLKAWLDEQDYRDRETS